MVWKAQKSLKEYLVPKPIISFMFRILFSYLISESKLRHNKMNKSLVSAKWLRANLNDPDLVVLDASEEKNMAGLDIENNHVQIIGARKFDLKTSFSDANSPFPTMLPTPAAFQKECRKLGINNQSEIVVYDNLGIYTSPRVWWMFKVMGHEKVSVLNGGLPGWKSNDFPTEKEAIASFAMGDFTVNMQEEKIKSFDFIRNNIKSENSIVIDARSADRFNGIVPEPRKGIRSGSISKSFNVPFTEVLKKGFIKSNRELEAVFSGVDFQDRSVVFTCGSGVTACIVMLAFEMVKNNTTAVYDGSWTEWATLNPK